LFLQNVLELNYNHNNFGVSMSKIDDILGSIEGLEKELVEELRAVEGKVLFTIRKKKVQFGAEIRKQHKELMQRWSDYVYDSGVMVMLTVPIIWGALIPIVFLDFVVTLYQLVCFPVYGIPRVKRGDYIVIDRHSLAYMNWMEKVNCVYCGYFNGLISFVREVAARTEQYWCPVRHARPVKAVHSRYRLFFEYGDAKAYRQGLGKIRTDFDDVREKPVRKGRK